VTSAGTGSASSSDLGGHSGTSSSGKGSGARDGSYSVSSPSAIGFGVGPTASPTSKR
jgi:hypothetical protein